LNSVENHSHPMTRSPVLTSYFRIFRTIWSCN